MTESTIVKTKGDATITLASQSTAGGGGFVSAGTVATGASSYVVAFEAGDFSITNSGGGNAAAINNFLDRGAISSPPSIRKGDASPITFSFSLYFRQMTDSGADALMDILNNTGNINGNWTSTASTSISADDSEIWAVDLKLAVVNPGDVTDSHFLVLNTCTLDYSIAEGDPTTVSINGTSWASSIQYVG
jgi:hypothetical protein